MQKILLIEDDVNLGTTLTGALEEKGYKLRYLQSGNKLKNEIADFTPDIILLDVNLNEKEDGFDLAHSIRQICDVPVIFTTSRSENDDIEQAFSISNADYIRKPFRLAEVLKRVERMLQPKGKPEIFRIGIFSFVLSENCLKQETTVKQLNHYESEVLKELCAHVGQYVNRSVLIEKIWKVNDPKLKEGSLNNIVSSLRKHLEVDPHVQIESKIKLGIKLTVK